MVAPLAWAPFHGGPWGFGAVLGEGNCVAGVLLPGGGASIVDRAQRAWPGAQMAESGHPLRSVAQEIARRFESGEGYGDLPMCLPARLTPFARRVSNLCREIEPGTTRTYAALAASTGSPGGARAVGQVMARNPLPLLVPCHRVVPTTGGVGQFGGGAALKEWLLEREARAR